MKIISAHVSRILSIVAVSTFAWNPVHAGRYELIKQSDPGESYAYSDVPGGVCEAYEKNLARFESEPYGMACGRKLDPALGFTRPTWEKLDAFQHVNLLQQIYSRPGEPELDAESWMKRLKEMVGRGMVIEITRLDLDGDGKPENMVRVGSPKPCDPKQGIARSSMTVGRGRFMVIVDQSLTKVEATILPPDDVFLYKGKVYADALGMSHQMGRPGGPDAALFLFGFLRYGAGDICKFHYYVAPSNHSESKAGSKP